MSVQTTIQEAQKYMRQAALYRQLADEQDYKASRLLQGVSTPSTSKKNGLGKDHEIRVAQLIARRNSKIKKAAG